MYSVVYLARCSNLFHPSNILSMNSENLETGNRCPGDLHSHAEIQTQYHTIVFSFVETLAAERRQWSCVSRERHIGRSPQRSLWILTNDLTCLSFVGLIITIQICSEIMVMGVCFQYKIRWILTVIHASASCWKCPCRTSQRIGSQVSL